MEITNLLNQIEKEERQQREHKQNNQIAVNIETLKGLTIGEIKKLNEEFNKQ